MLFTKGRSCPRQWAAVAFFVSIPTNLQEINFRAYSADIRTI